MIHVSHLTKKYGATTAVDDISFEIQQGEIVGYLGPNGAGKSTTLKMLIGLLQPTSGEISVAGYDAATQLLELKRHIGYVPEEAQLYEHLTLVEHLQLIGRLYFCIATFIWGVLGIFYVLPGFILLINYVILYPKPLFGLPLTEEFIQSQIAGAGLIPFLLSFLIIVVFMGIQFLTYLLNIWVYYGFYCVTVVGGFIGFVYFSRGNEWRKS